MSTMKLSKQQWEFIGKRAGWIKTAQSGYSDFSEEGILALKAAIEANETMIVLYGGPMTGKSVAPKQVAKELGKQYVEMNLNDAMSMHVGQTEENVKKLFENILGLNNAMVIFDEIDGQLQDEMLRKMFADFVVIQRNRLRSGKVSLIGITNKPSRIGESLQNRAKFIMFSKQEPQVALETEKSMPELHSEKI